MKQFVAISFWLLAASAQGEPSPAWTAESLGFEASYPEAPLVRARDVLYADYGGGAVRRFAGGEVGDLWRQEGCGPSGLVELQNGDVLVACYDSNELVRISATGLVVGAFARDEDGNALRGPNDLVQDASGGVYFTTSGVFDVTAPAAGKVYYMTADGRISLVAQGIHYSNGVALSPDEGTLYVNEHLASRVLAFPLRAAGTAGAPSVLIDLEASSPGREPDPYRGPDGLKVDVGGRLYACEFGGGRVLVVSPEGKLLDEIPVPMPYVTNVALSGASELYVTALNDAWRSPYPGSVFRLRRGEGR